MKRSWRLHQTITGAPSAIPFVCSSTDWRMSMSDVGRGRFEIPLALTRFSPEQWHQETRHWWMTLVELHDDVPKYAGLIRDKDWDADRQTLIVDTVTVDALWSSRFPWGVAETPEQSVYLTAAADFKIVSKSMRGALEQAIYRGMGAGLWGPTWPLPFVFHYLNEAGGFSKTWKSEDWPTIAKIIDHIRALEGGPDVAYLPQYADGAMLQWDILTGDPRVPGPTVDVPASVRRSRVAGLHRLEAGVQMLSGMFGRGEGFGKDRPVGQAGFLAGPAMPVRDAAADLVATDAEVQELTEKRLQLRRNPTEGTKFTLSTEDASIYAALNTRDLRLGSRINWAYSGDYYLPPETQTMYVTGLGHNSRTPHSYTPEVVAL